MINYLLSENSVTVVYDDKIKTFSSNSNEYSFILSAIRDDKLDDIVSFLERDFNSIIDAYGSKVSINSDCVMIDGELLPDLLAKRLKFFAEQKLDYSPLVNFWRKLKQNPSYHCIHELFSFMENNHLPLYSDGDFMGWKGVTEDMRDCYTKTINNSVGSKPSMLRGSVNDDYRTNCSNGFHVGSFKYASEFGDILVEVKVNPSDIVAVDCSFDKMRVCEYEVMRIVKNNEHNEDEVVDEHYCSCDIDDECETNVI